MSFDPKNVPPLPPMQYPWVDAEGRLTPDAYRYMKFLEELVRQMAAFLEAQNP